jgi:hypothetical protein
MSSSSCNTGRILQSPMALPRRSNRASWAGRECRVGESSRRSWAERALAVASPESKRFPPSN